MRDYVTRFMAKDKDYEEIVLMEIISSYGIVLDLDDEVEIGDKNYIVGRSEKFFNEQNNMTFITHELRGL